MQDFPELFETSLAGEKTVPLGILFLLVATGAWGADFKPLEVHIYDLGPAA